MNRLSGIPFASSLSSRVKRLHSKSVLAICLASTAGISSGCQTVASSKATSQLTSAKIDITLPKPAVLIDHTTNLYQVDSLLFRSEQLHAEDIALLKDNNIDAIVNLRIFGQKSNHKLLKDLIDDTAISLCSYPLKTWYITPQEVAEALTQIKALQAQDKRVLVHCYHGSNRTGIIVAMYRILEQEWTIEQAKQEMIAGDFGYHPMWFNLRAMLNPATIAAVRSHM